jgi:murein DD-endopeptidase MepM/ murein hydrolase activator NlpD
MGKQKTTDKKNFGQKLRSKYRLVILNDDTFEEKLSIKLSRLNVFFLVGVSTIFLIAATTLLIAFTPLREYIPGYSSTSLKRTALSLVNETDSLKRQLTYNQRYLLNIQNILEGRPALDFADTTLSDSAVAEQLNTGITKADEELRAFVENEERFNLSSEESKQNFKSLSFFTPVNGLVTNEFSAEETHYGIDIVAQKNEVIKAAQDGVVIFSEWTAETGHVLIIQHAHDFITVYKHNSALLKKQGSLVKVGEPIAIIGNSGELSTGPHLHFELWYKGNPINPKSYVVF